MMLDAKRTVRDFAVEIPGATRVFERIKIDYCCGGDQPLADACVKAGINVEEVLRLIEETDKTKPARPTFQTGSMAKLAQHVVDKHHVFTRSEIARLADLIEKVCAAHAVNHPELLGLRTVFEALSSELEPHMMKEERILFPYIEQLEIAALQNRMAPPAMFGTVRNPIAMMMKEHDAAGDLLREMRRLCSDFRPPADACVSYRILFRALEEFEADLHEHIHLENNILFPGALALESRQELLAAV